MIADNIRGSIIKFTNGLITDINALNSTSFQFVDWDTHANMHEIPQVDLLGPNALAWRADDTFCEITVAIGVSTINDANLFKSWGAISYIFEKLLPKKTIPFYESSTQVVRSYMIVVDGTTVAPMSRAEIRPYQFVQASLLLETSFGN